ncbi:hypothetical protein PR048_033325 [Dryococelus australis]|uniref:Uncharacterized protein n=1 Tax=Dryococelus australis TaxID=614101 RepID=A0ABQ9G0X1_9NEOP|nr:hypothetical protein PR048_033325 [Dryococelus australis]
MANAPGGLWAQNTEAKRLALAKSPHWPAILRDIPLVHTVLDTSWRTLVQSSPSTATADNQCAADIGMFVHVTVKSSLQFIDLRNLSGLYLKVIELANFSCLYQLDASTVSGDLRDLSTDRHARIKVAATPFYFYLGSPLVYDLPIMKAVKYRVVSGVVWANRTMVSSNTRHRTGALAAVDIDDSLLNTEGGNPLRMKGFPAETRRFSSFLDGAALECKGGKKLEHPEKIRKSGGNPVGIEPGLPWWEAGALATAPPPPTHSAFQLPAPIKYNFFVQHTCKETSSEWPYCQVWSIHWLLPEATANEQTSEARVYTLLWSLPNSVGMTGMRKREIPEKNLPTSDIVRHDSRLRKSRARLGSLIYIRAKDLRPLASACHNSFTATGVLTVNYWSRVVYGVSDESISKDTHDVIVHFCAVQPATKLLRETNGAALECKGGGDGQIPEKASSGTIPTYEDLGWPEPRLNPVRFGRRIFTATKDRIEVSCLYSPLQQYLGIGKFREFNDHLARLRSGVYTRASDVCSLAVACGIASVTPHLAVWPLTTCFIASPAIGSKSSRTVEFVKRFGRLLTARPSELMMVVEENIERHRNEGAVEAGDPREDQPANGIVRHDSHLTRPGIEHGSPWWEASVPVIPGHDMKCDPRMERRWFTRAGETGVPRENPPASPLIPASPLPPIPTSIAFIGSKDLAVKSLFTHS